MISISLTTFLALGSGICMTSDRAREAVEAGLLREDMDFAGLSRMGATYQAWFVGEAANGA